MLNTRDIGESAGLIWSHLRDAGAEGVTMGTLKKIDGLRADQVVAALGWLAREGKVDFSESRNRVSVTLVESEFSCC